MYVYMVKMESVKDAYLINQGQNPKNFAKNIASKF